MDEAGRGAWAGPVVAAAVILPSKARLPGLDDSKKLTTRKREELFAKIQKIGQVGVGLCESWEVDVLGLKKATNLAFLRAIQDLNVHPDLIWIDGNDRFKLPFPSRDLIRGDSKMRCIMAASIIAKVTRDVLMKGYSKLYSHHAFESHKGYGTERHHQALKNQGLCALHRKSYRPIKAFL